MSAGDFSALPPLRRPRATATEDGDVAAPTLAERLRRLAPSPATVGPGAGPAPHVPPPSAGPLAVAASAEARPSGEVRSPSLPPGSRLAARLPGLRAPPPAGRSGPGLEGLVPARETPGGRLHLLEREGGAWPDFDATAAAAVARARGPLDLARPLFLDTETTGLAGGTGTLPFLVGVALEREGRVVVEQAHLEAPGRERAVLSWLSSRLAQATALVTFNGKSFDWPLLRSRYVMNRLPVPTLPGHLDLLHCARRVFRHEAAQHSLQALERLALGVVRVDDLPGAQVPAVWFDYLRTGRLEGLRRVLEHNHRDVVSMVELLRILQEAWQLRRPMPPGARLALARLAVDRGEDERALRFLAGAAPAPPALAAEALELEAGVLRRHGAHREAAGTLEAALGASARPGRVRLELARLYERQLRDFEAARRHALLAADEEPAGRHRRRLERLERFELRGGAEDP